MKRLLTCVVLVGALAFGVRSLSAQDRPAGEGDKPAVTLSQAAADAVKAAFPKASVGKVGQIGRGDIKVFSVQLSEGEKKFSANVSDSGVIVSVTTPLTAADLPKVVADAVAAAAPGATITTVAKLEQRADPRTLAKLEKPTVTYQIGITKDEVKSRLMVAEDGTVKTAPAKREGK